MGSKNEGISGSKLSSEGIALKWLSITDFLFQCKGFDRTSR